LSAYTTRASLLKKVNAKRLAQMADDTNPNADITDATVIAIIDQVIADASAQADLILQGALDMTDGDNTTSIEPAVADITLYRLFNRNSYSRENPFAVIYDDAIKTLRMVAKGTYKATTTDRAKAAYITYTTDRERIFGRNTDSDDPLSEL